MFLNNSAFRVMFVLISILVLSGLNSSAQLTYRSKITGGNWNQTSTWESTLIPGVTAWANATTVPTASNSITTTIQAGSTVTITASTDGRQITVLGTLIINQSVNFSVSDAFAVDDLTSSGTLNVNGTLQNPGGTFVLTGTTTVGATGVINNTTPGTIQANSPSTTTINGTVNNTGTITNASGSSVLVNGVLTNSGTITSTATNLQFNSGGSYVHQYTTTAGSIPTATWNDGSICEFRGYTTSTTIAGNLNQSIYTFKWNCANQTSAIPVTSSTTAIRGDFIMAASGTGSISLSAANFTVNGDYNQSGGTANFNIASSGGVTTMNVLGNYVQSGGTLNLATATVGSVLNVAKNFTMSGGTLQKTGTGTGNVFFNGTTTQVFTKALPPTAVIGGQAINFTINNAAIVDFNTSVLDGTTGAFNLLSGGTLITANTGGISASGATGSIQNTGARSYSTGASYTYTGAGLQAAGTGLPAIVNNLTVNKTSAGVALTPAATLTVNGTLTLTM